MDSQFTEFQKCFTTKITSLNSYISVKFTLTLERLSAKIKTHRLLFVFLRFRYDLTIQGVTAECLLHRAEAPTDVE